MTFGKRIFDFVFGVFLAVLLAPVFAILVYKLWRQQGRPIFYVSERMKTPSAGFGLIKFRTMTVVKEDHGVSGAHKEARITPLGKWLRAKRFDELPQLWNIIKGDISFVGPRPPLKEYVEAFPDLYRSVLKSRPGVTGLATIRFHAHEGRLLAKCKTAEQTNDVYSRICVPRKAKLDLIYQKNRSLCYDCVLIIETLRGLFKRGKVKQ